jgi:LPXTG-site transpeptidase (sortase) family protein
MRMHGVRRWPACFQKPLVLLCLLAFVSPLLSAARPAGAALPPSFFVESTGHSLADPFLQFWIDNDGRMTLGNPVTEPVLSYGRVTQFFEYGVLVEGGDGVVSRRMAARELLELRHEPDATLGNDRRSGSEPRSIGYLAAIVPLSAQSVRLEPLYAVDQSFEPFYTANGAKSFLGKPLSNVLRNGERLVQWFEFGRLELRGGSPRLAPVGAELAIALDVDMAAVGRGDTPIFNPDRYQRFTGDGAIRNAEEVFIPTRIAIPRINVNAAIESVGVTNNVMDAPRNAWNVGWYPSMASPGEWTNVVMAGHRDWFNVGPVVFWNLQLLQPGDKIYVFAPDGSGATFVVESGWLIDADDPADPLIADTGFEALTLITCGGSWNGREYTARYVVRARRI